MPIAIMALTSCSAAGPKDLEFVSANVVDVSDWSFFHSPGLNKPIYWNDSPEFTPKGVKTRKELRINLSSKWNLEDYALKNEYTMGADARYCTPENSRMVLLGGGYLYMMSFYVYPSLDSVPQYKAVEKRLQNEHSFIYRVYLSLSDKEVTDGALASPAFDLLHRPADICLSIGGGAEFRGSFKSNEVIIPKSVVTQAIIRAGLK